MAQEPLVKRELYGGAIELHIPARFADIRSACTWHHALRYLRAEAACPCAHAHMSTLAHPNSTAMRTPFEHTAPLWTPCVLCAVTSGLCLTIKRFGPTHPKISP